MNITSNNTEVTAVESFSEWDTIPATGAESSDFLGSSLASTTSIYNSYGGGKYRDPISETTVFNPPDNSSFVSSLSISFGYVHNWSTTHNMQGESYKDRREIVVMLLTVLFSSVGILTIVSNLSILVAFCKTKKLRKPTNYFYVSLAVSDCLLGISTLPLAVYNWYQDGYWQLGEAVCILWLAIDYFLFSASIYNIAAICLDRYLALFYGLWYRRIRTNRFVIKLIATAWILGFVIEVPAITLWEFIAGNPTVDYDEHCKVEYEDHFVYTTITNSISPLIPCAWITFIYLRISLMIRTRKTRSQIGRKSPFDNKTHHLGDGNTTATVNSEVCFGTSDAKDFNDSVRPSSTSITKHVTGKDIYDSFPSSLGSKACRKETDCCNAATSDSFPVRGKPSPQGEEDLKQNKTDSRLGKINDLFELEEIAPREPDEGCSVAKIVDKPSSTESAIASTSDIDVQSTNQKTRVVISKSYESKKSSSDNKAAVLFSMVVASFLVLY
ncbi:muscarinic acetylcholine receptor M2-like [Ptychodera flava]|uniref:muscarinic acetylcholine receptor M2-like n=1 Tax=Ptychodera flava TaxID=63121 RepID=UPI00396A2D24